MKQLMRVVGGMCLAVSLVACNQNGSSLPKQKIEEFHFSSLTTPPVGWAVQETQGYYCRFFEYAGTGEYVAKFQSVMNGIVEEGKKKGANGFLNAHVAAESHEIQGSKWHASVVHLCGDFVVLR